MLKEGGKENREMQHCSDERKGNTTLTAASEGRLKHFIWGLLRVALYKLPQPSSTTHWFW